MLQGVAQAHETAPGAVPLLPSCHVDSMQCVSSQFATAQQPWRPTEDSSATSPITSTDPRIPDGKWLGLMPGILGAGSRLATTEVVTDQVCANGFADVYECTNIDLLAHLPPAAIGGQFNNDLWGWVDPLDGTEYALVGARDGVVFLDLSNPTAPLYLGKLPSHGNVSNWRDVKVYEDHAFVVADYNRNHGMQIFDLTELRNVVDPPVVFEETAHYANFEDAHNVAINAASNFAYTVGGESCDGGLHMIDIQTIITPTQAGCYTDDGYIHDTQCVIYEGPDSRYQGRELCFNAAVSHMTIVDVTEKTAPTRIGSVTYTGSAYIHQGWLTPDQRYFVLNDELDEWHNEQNTRTYLIDLADLNQPKLLGIYTAPFTSIDHNLYIQDSYVYEANYTTGLRILDGKDIPLGKLSEVAGFDTFPENNQPTFAGAWTAYPYFPSGIVVVNTIYSGVFVLQPQLPPDVIVADRTKDTALCRDTLGDPPYTQTVPLQVRNGYSGTINLGADSDSALEPTVLDETLTVRSNEQPAARLAVDLQEIAAGSYAVNITVATEYGVQMDEVQHQLHLADAIAAMPTLVAPLGRLDNDGPTTFRWDGATDAHRYRYELASDPDFSNRVMTVTTANTSYELTQPLDHGRSYYWRVFAINGCGESTAAAGEFQSAYGLFLPLIQR